MATVDVVVPCYNYGRFLQECVASVLSQKGCAVRILIIDDASTDSSSQVAKQIAAQDDRVHLLTHKSNIGHIETYNEGVAWARSEYFLLLSADDMLMPGSLHRAVSLMEKQSDVCWTYGRDFVLHPGEALPRAFPFALDQDPSYRVVSGAQFIERLSRAVWNHVPTCTAVVRTSAQKEAGLYRPELPHAGDLEMWLRLSRIGAVAEFTSFQGVRRLHGANMQGSFLGIRDLRQRWAAFESFLTRDGHLMPGAERSLKQVRRRLSYKALRLSLSRLRRGDFHGSLDCLGLAFELNHGFTVSGPISFSKRVKPLSGPTGETSVSRR
jgi:glycosyltransferase involved in cell wall biosynthesis